MIWPTGLGLVCTGATFDASLSMFCTNDFPAEMVTVLSKFKVFDRHPDNICLFIFSLYLYLNPSLFTIPINPRAKYRVDIEHYNYRTGWLRLVTPDHDSHRDISSWWRINRKFDLLQPMFAPTNSRVQYMMKISRLHGRLDWSGVIGRNG